MKINLRIDGQYCAGLGDVTTWAWIADGANEPFEFFANGTIGGLLSDFGQRVTNNSSGSIDPNDCYKNELNERGARPRFQIWADTLGITTTPKRPKFAGGHNFTKHKNRVVLCPQSHFKSRTWPASYWLKLNYILIDRGFEVIFAFETDSPDFAQRSPSMAYWGYNFHQLAEMYRSAEIVVANDSFPAHFAGTLGLPTIAICGPTRSTVFAHIPDVEHLASTVAHCTGCHFSSPFSSLCDIACQSLNSLMPEKVADQIQNKLRSTE